jgi:hypothetical protein
MLLETDANEHGGLNTKATLGNTASILGGHNSEDWCGYDS